MNEIIEIDKDVEEMEEVEIDLSNLIATDSNLPIKDFEPIPGNSVAKFKIKMMSATDKDRFEQWRESRPIKMVSGMDEGETISKKFGDLLKRYLIGWSGFTLKDAMSFIPIQMNKLTEKQINSPFKFTQKNANELFKNDRSLCLWVLGIASNRERFQSLEDIDRLKK